MRILFVYPNARRELIGFGDLGAISEPLALEYLAAVGQEFGAELRLLDLRLHPGELERTLEAFDPDVVTVTGFSMHVYRILEICAAAKARRRSVVNVVGGHHATLRPEDFRCGDVNYVVTGEGTQPFRAILRRLTDRLAIRAPIPGVWEAAGEQWQSGGAQSKLDLSTLPLPLRTLAPADRPRYFIDWMRPIALMRTTVGCPYRCSFCSLWKIMDGRYYRRDADKVVEELHTIPEPYVFLVDDEPFINAGRMDEIAGAIAAAGIRKEYFSYCRIDTLTKNRSTLERWMEIGLRRVFIGIEGVTQRELSDFNKRLTLAQVEKGLGEARAMGLKVFASFIVNPSYTETDFNQLIRFIERNRIDYPSFTILTPLPGTDQFTEQYDLITQRRPDGLPDWEQWDLQNLVVPSALPRDVFHRQYSRLRAHFRGCYERHQRDSNTLVSETIRSRHVTPY